jgi:hypothetical protein
MKALGLAVEGALVRAMRMRGVVGKLFATLFLLPAVMLFAGATALHAIWRKPRAR